MSTKKRADRFVASSPVEMLVQYIMLKHLETSTDEGIGLPKWRLLLTGKQAYYGATAFTIPSTQLCKEAARIAERCFIELLTDRLIKPTERFGKIFYVLTDDGQTSIDLLSQRGGFDSALVFGILQKVREVPSRRMSDRHWLFQRPASR